MTKCRRVYPINHFTWSTPLKLYSPHPTYFISFGFLLKFAYKHNATKLTIVLHKSSSTQTCFIHACVYYYKQFNQVYAYIYIYTDSTCQMPKKRKMCILRKIHVNVVLIPWIYDFFSFYLHWLKTMC